MELDRARAALDRALEHAERIGVAVSCCVVDGAGQEVVTARMDGAPVFTTHIARSKARTSALLRMDTSRAAGLLADHPGLGELIGETVPFTLTTLGGGVAVLADGRLVGAIACSGATPDQDADCARAGEAELVRP